jgi:hypothetical protein
MEGLAVVVEGVVEEVVEVLDQDMVPEDDAHVEEIDVTMVGVDQMAGRLILQVVDLGDLFQLLVQDLDKDAFVVLVSGMDLLQVVELGRQDHEQVLSDRKDLLAEEVG